MNQDLSPNTLLAQKAVTDHKQVTTIRKITIEALSPVIAKLEEHITYLLKQTSNVRFQNANLITATANQKHLQQQISAVNQTLSQMTSKIISLNHQKDMKLQVHESQSALLRKEVSKIKEVMQNQQKRINFISNNNDIYLQQIQRSKNQQINSIEQLKIGIQRYYEKQISKIDSLEDQMQNIKTKLAILQENRIQDQQQIVKVNKIASLYQYQREGIKKSLEKAADLQNNIVMISNYQKDKKFQKIQNQLIKTDIQTMLNQALTPQIRHFLPILIKKLDELNSFDKRLANLTQKLQTTDKKQSSKLQQLLKIWQDAFKQINNKLDQNYSSLKNEIQEEIQRLQLKITRNSTELQQFRKQTKQQIATNQQFSNQNIIKLQENIKIYIEQWGQPFLQRKKQFLYRLMEESKPKQKIQEIQKQSQLVYSMEPLLNEVKLKLDQANIQLRVSKETLNEKLTAFNYQIVKIKTDINRQVTETKRILDSFQLRLDNNRIFNTDISQMIASLTETILILYSLSLDRRYLQLQHQVYVTYNDGIICQIHEDSELLNYRRKNMHPQLLKRAVIAQMIKFIDSTVIEKPQIEWNVKQNRPSHFFEAILSSYVTLYRQNAYNIEDNIPEGKSASLQKKIDNAPTIAQIQQRSSTKRKFVSNKEVLSQTIDFSNFKSKNIAGRYEKQEEPYLTNRKNIRLKKLQKRDI